MRILFVSHYFPPAQTAGTETYAFNVAQRLKYRHKLLVFHTEKRVVLPQYEVLEEEFDGIEKRVMINNRCYHNFGETYSNTWAEDAFRKVLDDFKPDIVHVHHLMYISLNLPAMIAERGIPVVMTLHDFFLACPRGGQFMLPDKSICPGPEHERCLNCLSTFKYRQKAWENKMITAVAGLRKRTGIDLTKLLYFTRDKVVRRDSTAGIVTPVRGDDTHMLEPYIEERKKCVQGVYDNVTLFMTPSITVGEGLKANGLPREKLRLWKYGIDVKPFKNFKRPERLVPVVAYLGTLMPHKGVHLLVEAASSLPRGLVKTLIRGPGAKDPGYAQTLRDQAGPDILFEPGFNRSEVRHAFSEIDVLVLPSLWLENSPVVIQEAFACGCPVITSDLGGMKELVHDRENGRLFPAGDAKALAAILEEVGNHPDVIESWRKGIRMPRTIEDDVESLETLYEQLSGNHTP
ncbi:MAG: glycosyltransferase family 4 protein [Planctomycetota bacterium]